MLDKLLKPYSEEDKISLLIRHSNRYDFQEGADGNEPLLTEQGKANACQLGKNLIKYNINKIITTSVERCIQTAEYIAQGYGKPIEITPSEKLGGLHVENRKFASDFLNKNGYEEWYRRIVNDISTPGICDSVHYKELMTSFLVENTNKNGLTIFVSHDFLIAFYHYALNKTIYTMYSDWVNYLSGLTLKNGQYVARFQNN